MVRRRRSGFTLVEILVVIVIIGLLASLLIPTLGPAICQSRQAAAAHLVKSLTMACTVYGIDWATYPPGDGRGSADLVAYLRRPGPKGQAYLEITADMVCAEGFVNPVWPDQPPPQGVIHYRNNQRPAGGGGNMPPVFNTKSFDIWCAGCSFKPSDPTSAWEVNNW